MLASQFHLLQLAAVQYILDTVVQALDANPDRRFVYGEMVSCRIMPFQIITYAAVVHILPCQALQ